MREVTLLPSTGGEDCLGWMGIMTADDHALTRLPNPGLQEAPQCAWILCQIKSWVRGKEGGRVLGCELESRRGNMSSEAKQTCLLFAVFLLCLYLAVLGLHCCEGFSLVVAGYSLLEVCWLLTAAALRIAEDRLKGVWAQ